MNLTKVITLGLALTALTFTIYYNTHVNSKEPYQKEFLKFISSHKKLHYSPKELEYRYKIFQDNMKIIEEHNKEESSYKLGITEFADLTWEEFEQGYLQKSIQNLDFN